MSEEQKALRFWLRFVLPVVFCIVGLLVWQWRADACQALLDYPAWQCWLMSGR